MTFWLKPKSNIEETTSFAVDRVIEGIAVLINMKTGEILNVKLHFEVNDGDIVIYKDNHFIKSDTEYNKRKEEILSKFERLRRRNE